MNRRSFAVGLTAVTAAAAGAVALVHNDLAADARTAWLFALPLIEMAHARAEMLGRDPDRNRVNVLTHARDLSGPESVVVTTPNNDTLYSTAFVDLTRGPVRLQIPDAGSRYISVAVFNMWTDADVVLGARTPGGPAGEWRLIGPDQPLQSPRDLRIATPQAWVLARILVNGPSDLPAVRRLQDGLILSGAETPQPHAYSDRAAPWPDFFRSAAELMALDPPTFKAGRDAFERIRKAGRGGDFNRAGYNRAGAKAIDRGVAQAEAIIRRARGHRHFIDGWTYPPPTLGRFGNNVLLRAAVAVAGLGALPIDEAMYLRAEGEQGTTLFRDDGLYRLRLDKPVPVDGFWSLTMYEARSDGSFVLTQNALDRYAIGDRTAGLIRSPDGATDVWIGRTDPGGSRTANWLPAPARGPFALMMRAYLPRPSLRNGSYRLPRIVRV